jgi:hypothetical protein
MNKFQKREEVMSVMGDGKTILDVCMEFRMAMSGSSDPLPDEEEQRYAKYLQVVLDTWEFEHSNVLESNFDFAVRNLVTATLELYHKRQ